MNERKNSVSNTDTGEVYKKFTELNNKIQAIKSSSNNTVKIEDIDKINRDLGQLSTEAEKLSGIVAGLPNTQDKRILQNTYLPSVNIALSTAKATISTKRGEILREEHQKQNEEKQKEKQEKTKSRVDQLTEFAQKNNILDKNTSWNAEEFVKNFEKTIEELPKPQPILSRQPQKAQVQAYPQRTYSQPLSPQASQKVKELRGEISELIKLSNEKDDVETTAFLNQLLTELPKSTQLYGQKANPYANQRMANVQNPSRFTFGATEQKQEVNPSENSNLAENTKEKISEVESIEETISGLESEIEALHREIYKDNNTNLNDQNSNPIISDKIAEEFLREMEKDLETLTQTKTTTLDDEKTDIASDNNNEATAQAGDENLSSSEENKTDQMLAFHRDFNGIGDNMINEDRKEPLRTRISTMDEIHAFNKNIDALNECIAKIDEATPGKNRADAINENSKKLESLIENINKFVVKNTPPEGKPPNTFQKAIIERGKKAQEAKENIPIKTFAQQCEALKTNLSTPELVQKTLDSIRKLRTEIKETSSKSENKETKEKLNNLTKSLDKAIYKESNFTQKISQKMQKWSNQVQEKIAPKIDAASSSINKAIDSTPTRPKGP